MDGTGGGVREWWRVRLQHSYIVARVRRGEQSTDGECGHTIRRPSPISEIPCVGLTPPMGEWLVAVGPAGPDSACSASFGRQKGENHVDFGTEARGD